MCEANTDTITKRGYWEEINKNAEILAIEGKDQVRYGPYSDPEQAIHDTASELLYPHRWFVYHASSPITHGSIIAYGEAPAKECSDKNGVKMNKSHEKIINDLAWKQFRADCIRQAKVNLENN
jgi:hypothetical protein